MSKKSKLKLKAALYDQMLLAIKNCDEDALALALERGANARINNSQPIYMAVKNGFSRGVEILIPHSDPQSMGARTLLCAIDQGHLESIKILLSASISYQPMTLWTAWHNALRSNKTSIDVLKLLMNLPTFESIFNQSLHWSPPHYQYVHHKPFKILSHCLQIDRFDFFAAMISDPLLINILQPQENDQHNLAYKNDILEILAKTTTQFSRGAQDQLIPDSRYLDLWFDCIKNQIIPLGMSDLIKALISDPDRVDFKSYPDSLNALTAKWEQWQLEQSIPTPLTRIAQKHFSL